MTMEAYSSSYSSSNSAYLSQKSCGEKRQKPVYPFQSQYWLHSVRKSQAKPWKKAPVAPAMPPKPVKVYKVDALNFRELVQQLTGARAAAAATSADVAMPPSENPLRRDIAAASPPVRTTNWYYQGFQSEAFGVKSHQDNTAGEMAPSSYINWCSFPTIMSPGNITTLEPSRIL